MTANLQFLIGLSYGLWALSTVLKGIMWQDIDDRLDRIEKLLTQKKEGE